MMIEKKDHEVIDHGEALSRIINYLEGKGMLNDLVAVGHRIVHGGSIFTDSALVTDESLEQMKSVSHLAPL